MKRLLNNLTIKNKLISLAAINSATLVGLCAMVISQMNSIGNEIEGIAERDLPLTKIISEIKVHQLEQEVMLEAAARYGMTTRMVNQIVEAALGGSNVTATVEGRDRYPVRVRYQRSWRERLDELKTLPVVTHSGEILPLQSLAKMTTTWGPGAINSENAQLVAHVSFAPSGNPALICVLRQRLIERREHVGGRRETPFTGTLEALPLVVQIEAESRGVPRCRLERILARDNKPDAGHSL